MEHPVVSHDQWLSARRVLLEKEKAFTRQGDELNCQLRESTWEEVTKEYEFEGDDGRETLADLFAGRSQLVVYHSISCPRGVTKVAEGRTGSVVPRERVKGRRESGGRR